MSSEKVVIATTKRINGLKITREALLEAAETINGDKAVRQGLEHDHHYAPIGKVRAASVVDVDEESALTVLPDDTHVFTDRIHEPTGIRIVELTFPNDTRPFVIHEERTFESALTVNVDWANFDNEENFNAFCETTDEDGDSVVGLPMGRRSLVPDPLIQFAVDYPVIAAALTWVFLRGEKFLRYTVDQTLRKTGDAISEKISEKIKEWIGVYNKTRAPHEQPVTSHVIINSDPQIHLLTRSQDTEHNTEIGIESLGRVHTTGLQAILDVWRLQRNSTSASPTACRCSGATWSSPTCKCSTPFSTLPSTAASGGDCRPTSATGTPSTSV